METENNYIETDLGNVAPNPRGEYSGTATYEYLDLVEYGGGSYLCIQETGTVTGTAPVMGRNTDAWQILTLPGDLTPEYIAMHDDVVNKAESAQADAASTAADREQVESMLANVEQLHDQTETAAQEASDSRDSAAGYAAAAEASRTAAAESEKNAQLQVSGFDETVETAKQEANEAITETRKTAVQAVAAQQIKSVQDVKSQTAQYITDQETVAKTNITKHTDSETARANAAMQTAKNALDKSIEDAQKLDTEIGQAVLDAKNAAKSANDAASAANSANETAMKAETERKSNEETRVKNETARSENEVARVNAEKERQNAEAQRVTESAEAIKNANDTADALRDYTAGQADVEYKEKVSKATSKAEVDDLFVEWWKYQYKPEIYSKSDMLERWFGNVLEDARVHGVTTPRYSKSTSMIGELTDDSAGLVCVPSTETVAGSDPFAHLPQFWCLEVAAEKNADGSHTIYYVEHIDDTEKVRSGEYLCWVLQKNTYKREWQDSEYKYLRTRCHPAAGYKRWPEGTDRTGKVHEYMAHPKYYAGIATDGRITCGTGLAPVNRTSHLSGVTKWRARGAQYSGASGSLPKFIDLMTRLKYGRKGNSGKIDGCVSYSYQYTAAVGEAGVERIILTTAQAANLYAGSSIMLGIKGDSSDRNLAYNYSICDSRRIKKIEAIDIDGTSYAAVYIDNGGKTFDTTADSTYISTSPYYSGWNDNVLGRDGSRYNPTSGKEPGMIQGVEFMNGSYLIVSDELWQWSTDADGNYNFDCFKCYDQSKVGSTINANYEQIIGAHLVYPAETTGSWTYITDNIIDDNVLWPEATTAAGSGVGVGAGFRCYPVASGVRAAWVWGNLNNGGNAGASCRNSNNGPSNANWNGSLGATGTSTNKIIAPYNPRLCAKIT